jgi:hypothetical protein
MQKTFDCVGMKREGAERLRQKLAGLTPDQVREFWRERTEALLRKQQDVRSKTERRKESSAA